MAIIEWDKSAWLLFNTYLENAKLAFGRKTALRWENEMLHIYFYDDATDTIHIMDIWDTRMSPTTLTKRIK